MTHLRSITACACLALAAATTSGCFARRTPAIRYYTLSVPRPAAATLDATIVVSGVTADAGYAGTRMAWRPSPYRVDYASFQRWIAAPPIMLASLLEEHLRRAATGNPERRVLVSAAIRRIEAVRDEGGRAAVLALLLRADIDGRRVVERAWDEREPLAEGDDAEAVAAALSTALARILDDFTAALAAALAAG
jgi:ABC-type uncharacterized transport system auxiliary subunit